MQEPSPIDEPIPPPWQPRYTLASLLLATLVVCAIGTAASYLVRSLQTGRSDRFLFILCTLAGPALLVVVVSLVRLILTRRR